MNSERTAVLLLAHGSPGRAEDVPAFLRNVTGGRNVPEEVLREVEHRYRLIGRSPLREITEKQAEALRRKLAVPVYAGMRNWTPYVAQVVLQMIADGITRAVAICMAPHNSRTSVGLYRSAAFAEAGEELRIDFVDSWHDHPLLIAAFAQKLAPAWRESCERANRKVPVIFTAHSVPERTIEAGDPYEAQAKQTAALVASQIPELVPELWRFAFQSQGMSGGKWIGPTVEETILSLKTEGHGSVLVQPIGFVCDHIEVLYDIDIGFKEFARTNGMELTRAESLNDSPLFIDALAALAQETLARSAAPERAPTEARARS